MPAKIGIVIVNYNGAVYQNDCMHTIFASSYQDFEVIVVDSGSHDNSLEMLQKEYPQVTVLPQNENVGVAVGNNIGIKYAIQHGMEYTLLMNNDVEIDPKVIETLLAKASKDTITVPKIYYYEPHDLLWFAGGELNWKIGSSYHTGLKEHDSEELNREREISYAPTCCMLIHNSVFKRIGLIEEKYFMYFDDTDLCARIQEAQGLRILYVPEAVMWHKVSSSTGGEASKVKIYYQTRNKLIYMNKFKDKIGFSTVLYSYFRMFLSYAKGVCHRTNSRIIIRAIRDYQKGYFYRQQI